MGNVSGEKEKIKINLGGLSPIQYRKKLGIIAA